MNNTMSVWTSEIPAPWLRPPVTNVHLNFRARLRRRKNRFLASAFVADVKAGWQRSLAVLGAFAAVYAFIVVLRGAWFAAVLIGAAQ